MAARGITSPALDRPLKPADRLLTTEVWPLVQSLVSVWFWAALVSAAFAVVVAYQLPFQRSFDLDAPRDRPFLINYYAVQRYKDFVYRWTQPNSSILLKGAGQIPKAKITLELSPRPAGYDPADVKLFFNAQLVSQFLVDKPTSTYAFEYNFPNRNFFAANNGDLDIWLNMDSLLVKGDSRPLGVVVSKITVQGDGLLQTGRPVMPDVTGLLLIVACAAVLYLLLKRVGWSEILCAGWTVGFGLMLSIGLALDRLTVVLGLPLLLQALVLAYPLTVIGVRLTGWWLKRRDINFDAFRWLAMIFVLAFVVRAVGINHPSFQTLDHGFRIHEVQAIKEQPGLIFSRYYNINTFKPVGEEAGRSVTAGQWNLKVSIPYTPLFYVLDLPVAWLTNQSERDLLHWTNLLAVLLDASAVFLLYIIARQTLGRYGSVAGLTGSVFLCFFPLAYLMVSDGGYNTILATWLTLLWLAAFTAWFKAERPINPDLHGPFRLVKLPSLMQIFVVGCLLALAFLAHTATLLIVGTMLIIYADLLLGWRKTRDLALIGRMGVSFGVGFVLAFAVYYGFYFIPLLTNTLPTIGQQLAQGEKIGKDSQTIPSFWAELLNHFHLLPALLSVGLLALLLGAAFGSKRLQRWGERPLREVGPLSLMLMLAWLLTFGFFTIAATQINLLNKHMLFVLPLFALMLGLVIAMIVDWAEHQTALTSHNVRGRADRALLIFKISVIAPIVIWFIASGAYTWYIRAIEYVLPAGTG